MKKGIITEYNEYCLFCGRPVEAKHHLIGGPNRKKAEEDGLKIPCCNNCHNIGDVLTRIHGNPMAEMMSKMMGQLAWKKRAVAGGKTEKEARDTEGIFVEQGKAQGSKVVLDGLKQKLVQYYGAEEEQIQISYGGEG